MPNVYWLISAQRALLRALSPCVPAARRGDVYRRICRILARTFPKAAVVLVRERLQGYRTHYDRHVLLVEVVNQIEGLDLFQEGRPRRKPAESVPALTVGRVDFELGEGDLCHSTLTTAAIVKIVAKVRQAEKACGRGNRSKRPLREQEADRLAQEMRAWNSCRPPGMTHHGILMVLRCGAKDAKGRLESIVYEDAHHVLGGRQVIALEDAVLGCVRWGAPTVQSLALVIKCVYEQLGADLYPRSEVLLDPDKNLDALRTHLRLKDLAKLLAQWKESGPPSAEPERMRTRREVLGVLANKPDGFMDPADYLASVFECADHCPQLLRGCAHGDLHGHNVLVSVADGDATLPALFDYEDMGPDRLVGWDFVKLETELKVRALPLVFAGREIRYIRQVYDFEHYLARRTQKLHDQEPEEEAWVGPESGRRLADLILAIRLAAREHMGRRRLRDRRWLEEYYFLLAVYGVRAACWETYQRRNVMAAWVSAGVAARLLTRPWQQLEPEVRKQETIAEKLLSGGNFDPRKYPLDRLFGEMSHRPRLAFCRKWCRSDNRPFVMAAARLLNALSDEYPHVLEIEDELILQYFELGVRDKAEDRLYGITRRYNLLSMEIMCRFGRSWKDEGVKRLMQAAAEGAARLRASERPTGADGAQGPTKPQSAKQKKPATPVIGPDARKYLQEALIWYRRAYDLEGDYYPGINVATLCFLIGDDNQARKVAKDVLEAIKKLNPEEAIKVWPTATKGEAYLLLGKCDDAASCYHEASGASPLRDRRSARRQAEAIVSASPVAVRAYWTRERLDEVFGPDSAPGKEEPATPSPAPRRGGAKAARKSHKPKKVKGKGKK